ncbi:hypothetical protein AWENTII_012605 [Aspergillus wentii]
MDWNIKEQAAKMDSHSFYLGKKVAFVYRAKREVRGSNIRVIWGKVTRTHGMLWLEELRKWKWETNMTSQVTPVLSVLSSATTSPPRPSVLPFALCSTPPTSKRRFVFVGYSGIFAQTVGQRSRRYEPMYVEVMELAG